MIEQASWIFPAGSSGERVPNERCIVGAGIGKTYRDRLRSTINHCAVHCADTWRLFYEDLPEGCPAHEEKQYAFKIYAMQRVINGGFRYVLWMDSSFQPIASIEPIWKHIEEHGWYVPSQADSFLGTWTSDAALRSYGIFRDHAMKIPLAFSGLIGLDMEHPTGKIIWRDWQHTFWVDAWDGPHYNQGITERAGYKLKGWCSDDPRCEGHRHDESALSFVLHQNGLKPVQSSFLTLDDPAGIIGHMVPDYDVVKMREAIRDFIGHISMNGDDDTSDLEALCR